MYIAYNYCSDIKKISDLWTDIVAVGKEGLFHLLTLIGQELGFLKRRSLISPEAFFSILQK